MINSSTELGSELSGSNLGQAESSTAQVGFECDWCGRAVSRETASERPGGDTGEVVLLCGQCAYGMD